MWMELKGGQNYKLEMSDKLYVCQTLLYGGAFMWNAIQCAVQGRSHIKSGIPCQDKTYSVVDDNIQVIALADGAGSAKFSHYGAEAVTKFICLELVEKFDTYFATENGVAVKQEILECVLKNLSTTAKKLECEIKELASTLLLVAIKDDKFIIAHIGDGVIGYLKNNEMKIASQPENGEFVNTTVFTTSKDAIMTMKLIKGFLGTIQGFVLMSDGPEARLYSKQENKLADVLKKIMHMSTIISIDKIQEQVRQSFESTIIKETTDDCSMAMLVKTNDSFKGYLKLSNKGKRELLKIKFASPKKIIRRYDDLLVYLQNKRSIHQIARKIHLKPKYAQRYIDKLRMLNFIEKNSGYYHTILIMDIENGMTDE